MAERFNCYLFIYFNFILKENTPSVFLPKECLWQKKSLCKKAVLIPRSSLLNVHKMIPIKESGYKNHLLFPLFEIL